jgi:hypothetical protein
MSHTGFGQSQSGVVQVAYVVEDLDAAIRTWVDQLGTGPWFRLSGFTGVDPVYRGEPSMASITLAMAFAGNMCIELIQPDDDHPSIWRDHIERHGYGFHHFGRLTTHYDADVKRYADDGHELVWQAGVPTGGRIGFIDTTDVLPGYQELIELDDATDALFTRFYAASLTWEGGDPVRPFG